MSDSPDITNGAPKINGTNKSPKSVDSAPTITSIEQVDPEPSTSIQTVPTNKTRYFLFASELRIILSRVDIILFNSKIDSIVEILKGVIQTIETKNKEIEDKYKNALINFQKFIIDETDNEKIKVLKENLDYLKEIKQKPVKWLDIRSESLDIYISIINILLPKTCELKILNSISYICLKNIKIPFIPSLYDTSEIEKILSGFGDYKPFAFFQVES